MSEFVNGIKLVDICLKNFDKNSAKMLPTFCNVYNFQRKLELQLNLELDPQPAGGTAWGRWARQSAGFSSRCPCGRRYYNPWTTSREKLLPSVSLLAKCKVLPSSFKSFESKFQLWNWERASFNHRLRVEFKKRFTVANVWIQTSWTKVFTKKCLRNKKPKGSH